MTTSPDGPRSDDIPPSSERWARVRALVDEVIALPPDARAAYLDASCGDDDALRDRVGRLAAAYERADDHWEFLAQPAAALAAPLLAAPLLAADMHERADADASADGGDDVLARLRIALADRYRAERELASGGMATVYVAHDVRHSRQVAIKVLHPELSAMLGAERFLSEIRTTAGLQHPDILPLFDSGVAGGLLFYVMPLVDGGTLRDRLAHEQQLPVADAVRIAGVVAGALDYAHRHGVIHRDVKPENILLHEGRPIVADFGIALAVQSAGAPRATQAGISLGTPSYMSPEQAAGGRVLDARTDVYSLACVLYEMLTGDPPFTGRSAQAVIARVLADPPTSARTARPSVPIHIDAAIERALAKIPADRHATAREFADALMPAPTTGEVPTPAGVASGAHARGARASGARASGVRWRRPVRVGLGAAVLAALAGAAAMALRAPAAPSWFVYDDLIEQSPFGAITITPDGQALVYTGSGVAGASMMLRPVNELAARAIAGTERGALPFVSPDGERLAFYAGDTLKVLSIRSAGDGRGAGAWRYGNGAWIDDSALVTGSASGGLTRARPGEGAPVELTRPDSARGEHKHTTPLVLPGERGRWGRGAAVPGAVVFTASGCGGPSLVSGNLAIAPLQPRAGSPSPHVSLSVSARRAVAFVDGWLLYITADGTAIMAVRLDVKRQRVVGTPIAVLTDEKGNLESAAIADDGTLLYVRRPRENSPVFVDARGAVRPVLANPDGSFMYPRFSPDGKRFAIQVTSACGEDLWLYDIASGTPTRLTSTGRARQPTWMPDGSRIVFMDQTRRLMSQAVRGDSAATPVPETKGAFAPSIATDGRTVVFQQAAARSWGIWAASLTGQGARRRELLDRFANYMPALSPDGRWMAYVSNATGRNEVYVRRFPGPSPAVQVSDSGGVEPAWSPDGRRIYYRVSGALMAAEVSTPTLAVTWRRQLFRGEFSLTMPHRDYDVAPDGSGFLMIAPGGSTEAVVGLDWLPSLRARLARER